MKELDQINSVLIRGANWVGDAVMTIPALREVRRMFPQARLTLWTKPALQDLFLDVDFVDDFLALSTPSLVQTAKAIKSGPYDVAILFQNAFRAAFVTWASRVVIRCGYRTEGRGILLTHAIPLEPKLKRQHQVFYYLHLVSQFEKNLWGQTQVNFDSPDQTLEISWQRREQGLLFLAERGVDLNKMLVIINPGATNSRAKQWLPDRFAAASDRLLARRDTSVVFIGAPEETDLAQSIASHMRQPPIVLTGQTRLRELVEILSCAQLLITNDTGPAHIGAAVGTPTLTLFGPTEHFATRPFSGTAVVIRQPVSCSPCMLRDCPIDHRCMTGITVEDVVSEATKVLDMAPPLHTLAARWRFS